MKQQWINMAWVLRTMAPGQPWQGDAARAMPHEQDTSSHAGCLKESFRLKGLLFGALFFCPFCFSAGKKERKKRPVRGEKAGP